MIPVYAQQPFPHAVKRTLFLAGPTPRSADVKSWRPEALEWLAANTRDTHETHVFVPEAGDGKWRKDYTAQVEWETRALARADAIVFWVPREITTMPAFTTNVEFGLHVGSGRTYYGRPDDAPKIGFLDYHAEARGLPIYNTLAKVLDAGVYGPGAGDRHGPDALIPLLAWKSRSFMIWLKDQKDRGNTLLRCDVPYASQVGFVFRFETWIGEQNKAFHHELYFDRY